ncbi:hypothetical protein N6H18_17910 [Reichenbachiella agarivorans]|uniref:Lipocalin-like domain-containing protein n=1 Tax=Reichenbachiella agarivorans TaxID=2979464 RepID=A0ABY6CS70_9BACT|nr:hypothetical protein [Reichenbachiella agarivorans]UXP32218.1 hypothetical protein N6H18_17910 [Reichenbachiella agarivorans]
MKNIWIALLLGSAFYSCLGDVEDNYSTTQANRLLSADSLKLWELNSRYENGRKVELENCFDANILAFLRTTEVDSVIMFSQTDGCASDVPVVVVYKARYEVVGDLQENFGNEIEFNTEALQDINRMSVLYLTSKYLKVSYELDGVNIEEDYSF